MWWVTCSFCPLCRRSRSYRTTPSFPQPAARPPNWEHPSPRSASSSTESTRISENTLLTTSTWHSVYLHVFMVGWRGTSETGHITDQKSCLFISSRKTMTHSICMRIWSNCNICRLNFCSKRADSWHHYPPPSLPAPTVQHIGFHTKLLMYNPLNHLTVASHCFETTALPVSANHHWASKSFSEIDSNVKSGLTDGVGTRVSPS